MNVVAKEVESYGRNASGTMLGGTVTFSDGKVWKWHRSTHTGEFFFTISSGVASQHAIGDYERMVAYPKRVKALTEKLAEMGELGSTPVDDEQTPPSAAQAVAS